MPHLVDTDSQKTLFSFVRIMKTTKNFQRRIEDFVCEKCGHPVVGNGYTNHCCECLWSKHVDIKPGDRAENCRGMMKPVDLVNRDGTFYIVQQCLNCGFRRKNKVNKGDNFNALVDLSSQKNI